MLSIYRQGIRKTEQLWSHDPSGSEEQTVPSSVLEEVEKNTNADVRKELIFDIILGARYREQMLSERFGRVSTEGGWGGATPAAGRDRPYHPLIGKVARTNIRLG